MERTHPILKSPNEYLIEMYQWD